MEAQAESSGHGEAHVIPYKVYVGVWLALLALTAVTVGVSFVDMRNVAVLTAVLIAAVKSSLVLLYFMHVRFERMLYVVMILAVLFTYAIFIGLTFADYGYR
jgi:cytochrome c oxidase subunit 4